MRCPIETSLRRHHDSERFDDEARDHADRIVESLGDDPEINDEAYTAEDVATLRDWLETVHDEATSWADEYVSDHYAEAVECRVLGMLDERISWAEDLVENGPNACEAATRGTPCQTYTCRIGEGVITCASREDRLGRLEASIVRPASAFSPRGAFALAMTRWHLARIGGAA